MKIPFKKTDSGVLIEVKVEPRSSRAEIIGCLGDTLKVKLTSPPVDGAANKQLIELLSKELGIKKSAIAILKGEKAKKKTVRIEGIHEL